MTTELTVFCIIGSRHIQTSVVTNMGVKAREVYVRFLEQGKGFNVWEHYYEKPIRGQFHFFQFTISDIDKVWLL